MKTKNTNRAENALYRLHNGGRNVPVALMQWLAEVAKRNGASSILVSCFTDGNTNGR